MDARTFTSLKNQKVVFFGIGSAYQKILADIEDFNIIPLALIDNDPKKYGTEVNGIKIISPESLGQLAYDLIVLATPYYNEMEKQLQRFEIPKNKILRLGTSYSFNSSIVETLDAQQKLTNKNFSLISDNCWGGLVYSWLGIQFQSPFINLIVENDDYLKLLGNLEYYLTSELTFNTKKAQFPHPVGRLKDVVIHLLHEETPEQAARKWQRRLERFNWNNIFVKFESDDLECLNRFDTLPFENKIAFTRNVNSVAPSSICLKEISGEAPNVGRTCFVCRKHVDLVDWFNHGLSSSP